MTARDETDGPAIAWVEAVSAVARLVGEVPLPKEVITVENADWKLTMNNTDAEQRLGESGGYQLGRFEIYAEGLKYFCFGIVASSGVCIGGMPEDQFCAEMKAMQPDQVLQ